jgi:TolA-binding protein
MAFQRRWILILFALILSGGQLFAASAKEQRAYAAAVAAFKDEMWSLAETELGQFAGKYKESTNAPMAVLLEAQAQFKQKKYSRAIALLNKNKANAGTLADQYVYWIGEAQFESADLTTAAETFMSLARDFPGSSLHLQAVAEAAAVFGQMTNWSRVDDLLGDTNGVFQRAAQLDPGNKLVIGGLLLLENSKFQQRDFPGVVAVYQSLTNHQWQKLNQEQQSQGTYLFYRAEMETGDFAAALAAASSLVQIAGSPTNQHWLAVAWGSQGAALKQMDRLPDALRAWQNNLANAPAQQEWEAMWKIAELEIVQGQLTNAEETLANFLSQFPKSISADIALLAAGELHLKDYAAQPAETNQLSAALEQFNQFLRVFANSPLAGNAYLNRGWCEWLANEMTNSLADFEKAAQTLPPSEDLAVARFKTGDAQFAMKDFAGAQTNYQAVLDNFTNFPAVARTLGDRALYQSLRASLELKDEPGASNALVRIRRQFPSSGLAPDSMLLYGQGLAAATNEMAARAVFEKFEKEFPGSPLRAEVEFDIAYTYELEHSWAAAISGYQGWLKNFPTNDLQPRADYALARANFQAGNETDAFGLFTNFVAQFPASDLAPLAQWWVADHFFRAGDFVNAERNYKSVFEKWPTSDLAYPARMMAGRAAIARLGYSDAIRYFTDLTPNTNCPVDLRVQAAFAYGAALMRMDSTETNDPHANFQHATKIFSQIYVLDPTNEAAALLATCEIADCDCQLNSFDAATNAYAQVFTSTNVAADVTLRSRAQIGFGLALEKMALSPGPDQTNLLNQALGNYMDVFNQKNLRDGETKDDFWVKKAGLQAAPLVGNLYDADKQRNFYGDFRKALPQLSDLIDQKIAALPPESN